MDSGDVRQLQEPNFGQPVGFGWNAEYPGVNLAHDHTVRLFRESPSDKFVHPEVYVESQSHEFWPSSEWNYFTAPSHNGADSAHSYLAADTQPW